MDTLRIVATIIGGLVALGGIYLTRKQLAELREERRGTLWTSDFYRFVGWLVCLVCVLFSLAYSSWRLLVLGFALWGMFSALSHHFPMMLLFPSTRSRALLELVRDLPWWSGLLLSLLLMQWLPFLIGVAVSLLLYLIFPRARRGISNDPSQSSENGR
jgi:hypothetical protein